MLKSRLLTYGHVMESIQRQLIANGDRIEEENK